MPSIDFVVECAVSSSLRARQVCSMFDVPIAEKTSRHWRGDLPIDERAWNVGLIVGPSGSGKSSISRKLFGDPPDLLWNKASVIDDFSPSLSVESITAACSAVGFNTIPAWLRPFHVLSNGEKFRVELARRISELPDPIVVDEFSSVVDRQVAKIGSYAVAKWIRKHNRKFVAVSCHNDIEEWLQPDWVFEPATMSFRWREVQLRPRISGHIQAVPRSEWERFSPFHYLTANLPGGNYYGLFVDGVAHPVVFMGVAKFVHPLAINVIRVTRIVTLPDWQGLGLAFTLCDRIAAAYKAFGWLFRNYPAHPSYIRSFEKSEVWRKLISSETAAQTKPRVNGLFGGRPCSTFEFCGDALPQEIASRLISTPCRKDAAFPKMFRRRAIADRHTRRTRR